ncbi:3-keto-disaccharide hydrolase [Urbifossiella limnaea]|uniref:3-keto-alpha-glucoside-1,2-lyase/3-keto-2-hydroxy-glucal hydratase domain-containing protein n=1 Tax=Urbifossiella limnaea TaxID=2528023 RepID=A0A517XVZ6_9BACT|nr:DUF1080 domain-containing protein [Urbifossiella limnaea]QDU21666.1 hypothetical protein ETAA1_36370 [Urbifossiella limnaea]
MRTTLSVALLLAFAGPVAAQPKAASLTPQEIADGWLMLFDGESTFGWKIDGAAEVQDGTLILGKGKKTVAYPTSRFGNAFEYEIQAAGTGSVSSPKERVEFESDPVTGWRTVTYRRTDTGVGMGSSGPGSVRGMSQKTDRPELAAAPFVIETDGTTPVRVRAAKLKPGGTTSLFNGKDLAGWTVNTADPKRAASKFEVPKDGELGVKNGPGDLKTDRVFGDFLFQMECKSNGKWLNSGVFFRCVPDQYQNGYEAQIQNAYLGDDRTKPLDFGTGAIYRRVAARKVVSNDHQWFTLTVLADGAHIATWVNGYQTVDWTDDRKSNDNPRQGLRTAAGHLSIQGHDPTTDLLFRRLRVAELR